MSDEKKPTAAERIAASKARSEAKVAAENTAREEQLANDLEAIEELESKLGKRIYPSQPVRTFVPGLPVVVGVRAPEAAEYKKLLSMTARAKDNGEAKVHALLDLARECWVYPAEPATRTSMMEANAALLASVGNFANSLAEVELKDEGKG